MHARTEQVQSSGSPVHLQNLDHEGQNNVRDHPIVIVKPFREFAVEHAKLGGHRSLQCYKLVRHIAECPVACPGKRYEDNEEQNAEMNNVVDTLDNCGDEHTDSWVRTRGLKHLD